MDVTEAPAAPGRRRLSRAEAKAVTRERLLEAAAQVFARKGFAGASVEEIAETAGYSIGALYSNFDGKEQLFLELLSARRARRANAVIEAVRTATAEHNDPLAALPGLLTRLADQDSELATLQTEFWLYAVRNPRARAALAAQTGAQLDALEEVIRELLARDSADSSASPHDLTVASFALVQGLLRQRRIDAHRVPDELIVQALRWLLTGARAETTPRRRRRTRQPT